MSLAAQTIRLEGADVVVTGGAGAIGSRLVSRLLDFNVERIVVIDDLSSGYRWLLPNNHRVIFHQLDVASADGVASQFASLALKPAPVFFHLAAFFANQNSVDHPADDLRTNGRGTLKVLQWAEAAKARVLVYASAGCSIAGHDVDGPIREDMPVSLHLSTPYQITKALGEFYCNYFHDRGLPTVRCRFFNSYGPGEVPGRYRNVIPNFIWAAMHDKPIVITGTGEETRDFIYVYDLVDGLIASARTPEAWGQAFNLGTGRQTKIEALAQWVRTACSSKSEIVHADRRAWDKSVRREADISRAKHVLAFEPEVPVRSGLDRTVKWFRENRAEIEASIREAR